MKLNFLSYLKLLQSYFVKCCLYILLYIIEREVNLLFNDHTQISLFRTHILRNSINLRMNKKMNKTFAVGLPINNYFEICR